MYPVTPWSRLKFLGWNLKLGSKYFSVYFYTGILSDYCKFACTKLRYCHWGRSSACIVRYQAVTCVTHHWELVTPSSCPSNCQTEMLGLLSVCQLKITRG